MISITTGHDFIVGVPCSKLVNLTKAIKDYIPVTREDEALGIAIGAKLVGREPLVFMQNSGLGHCLDLITSFLIPYGLEIDLLISCRTTPKHHHVMGQLTEPLLKLLNYKRYMLLWSNDNTCTE